MRCRDLAFLAAANHALLSDQYKKYFRTWWVLGIPAFTALVGVFYLMTHKPAHFSHLLTAFFVNMIF